MLDMVPWVFPQALHFLGLMVMNSSSDLIEYRMTLNSLDLHNSSGSLTLYSVGTGSILINRGPIQAIPTSLPPQPIREATKASNLQRIPPGIFLDYRVTLGFGSTGGLDLACPIIKLSSQYGIQQVIRYVLGIVGIIHYNLDILPPIRFGLKDVSFDDNEAMEVKALMALTEEESVSVSKECAIHGEWVQISIRKIHALLELEDNDKRKYFLDYLCIDLNYVKEQRNNLLSKHRDLVQTLNTCKEQLLVLKQAKLDCTTMQHASTKILKENKNRILGVDQLTEDPYSSRHKYLVFIKSLVYNTKASILGVERPWLLEAGGFILPNHDTGIILPAKSQRNSTNPLVTVIDSSETEYDSADESSVCSTSFSPLEKPGDVEPVSGPKTIKTTLKSISTFKTKALKGIIPNKPSSSPVQENKMASASKSNLDPAERFKECLVRSLSRFKNPIPSKRFFPPCTYYGSIDHLFDDCLYYPICGTCESYDHETNGHNRIISLEREINLRIPHHPFKRCEVYGSSIHTTTDHYDIKWFKRGEALQDKRAEDQKRTLLPNANRSKTLTKRCPL
ncbi:hypothetical protein Tco_1317463 [Tanacetum coccineum]